MHYDARCWTLFPTGKTVVHGTGHKMATLRFVREIGERTFANKCYTFLPERCFDVTTVQLNNVCKFHSNIVKNDANTL